MNKTLDKTPDANRDPITGTPARIRSVLASVQQQAALPPGSRWHIGRRARWARQWERQSAR